MFRVVVSILLLFVMSFPLQGCSRGAGATPSAGDAATAGTGPIALSWPAVDSLPRGVAATGPVITGSEYLPAAMTPQNVTTSGNAAVFASSAPAPARDDTLACALYGVDLSGWRGGAALDFTVDAWDDADELYFVVVMATASAVNLEQIAIGGEVPEAVLTTTPGDPGGKWSHLVNLSGPVSESISARHFRIRTEEYHESMGIVVNYTIRYYLECFVTVWTADGPEIHRFERLVHTDCFQA